MARPAMCIASTASSPEPFTASVSLIAALPISALPTPISNLAAPLTSKPSSVRAASSVKASDMNNSSTEHEPLILAFTELPTAGHSAASCVPIAACSGTIRP